MIKNLKGKVALITGASRGIGKGIAQVLVEAGATVYITGRLHSGQHEYKSVIEIAEELNSLNIGKCVGLICDHKIDEQTQNVFDKIKENENSLDILVNNAFGGLDAREELSKNEFWETDYAKMWDNTINVGLRSNYVVSCMAIKLMVPKKTGLIVNISSIGSIMPLFNPIYGVGKEGTDRLTFEMDKCLKLYNINVISLWPGLVRTEIMEKVHETIDFIKNNWHLSESTFLTGRAILALATDQNVASKSGHVHLVADLAHEYGFTDIDGEYPTSVFSARFLAASKYPWLKNYVPHFLKLPRIFLPYFFGKN